MDQKGFVIHIKDVKIEGASMFAVCLMVGPCLVMRFAMVPLKEMLELELKVSH